MSFLSKFKSKPASDQIEMQVKNEYPDLFNTTTSSGLNEGKNIMSYYWTNEDTKRAVIASAIPIGAVLLGSSALCQDQKYKFFLNTTRAPHWAPRDRVFYSALDVLTTLPLGYASYLVYKHGGGFDYTDTCVALGLYGTNLALALASVPLVKKQNLSGLILNSALVAVTASATAFAFYKIDQTAGYWVAPYALWTAFYAVLGYSVKELNPTKFD